MNSKRVAFPALLSLAAACNSPFAFAQDPVALTPKMYTVLLENDQVRVLDVRCKAGDAEPVHSHPAFVAYLIRPGKYRATMPDGKAKEGGGKPGTAVWSDAVTHTWECVGEQHVILFELKGTAKPVAQAPAPEELPPKMYTTLLENDAVRVLEVRCKAGVKAAMHSHPGFVGYVLKGGKFRETTPFGKVTETESKPGTAGWGDPVAHTFECLSEQHYVVVDLKSVAKP